MVVAPQSTGLVAQPRTTSRRRTVQYSTGLSRRDRRSRPSIGPTPRGQSSCPCDAAWRRTTRATGRGGARPGSRANTSAQRRRRLPSLLMWPERTRIRAGADARREPDIAGQVLGTREALDVAEFQHQEDGQERADAGDRQEALHAGLRPPQPDELGCRGAGSGRPARAAGPGSHRGWWSAPR